ncbi:hypothetical protein GP486_007284 [Trichoglossum hirsutum]|uniref:Myb-like domain-containing protein n=1 Tax=Trichoglossum hirsutum TaxID=265104 RepID=A0A9P8L4Z3_9PEZI|nr:hypothetical protein GP486_007284 [Trichoglossum hirsutum]
MSSPADVMNSPVHAMPSPPECQDQSSTEGAGRSAVSRAKARKAAATGGGRAWTEEEEAYLLQTRQQKMPYKHIASHLKKTELACRLHYHQLSHGSNRRKRTGSPASGSPVQPSLLTVQQPTSRDHKGNLGVGVSASPSLQSPALHNAGSPTGGEPSNARTGSASPQRHCKPILPKPTCYISSPISSHARGSPSSCCGSPRQLPRINCSSHQSPIDKERLRSIYDAHRVDFWKFIATEYGGGTDPHLLEETWKRGYAYSPPTPCVSPDNRNVSTATPCQRKLSLPSGFAPVISYTGEPERERAFSSINQPLNPPPQLNSPIQLARLSTASVSVAPTTPTSTSTTSLTGMPSMASLLTENSDPVKSNPSKDAYHTSASTPPAPRRVTGVNDILTRDVGT